MLLWRHSPRCACPGRRDTAGIRGPRPRGPTLRSSRSLPWPQLYSLDEDLRAAPPVVERLAPRRQRIDVGGAKTLLEEPVRGPRGEGEKAPQLAAAGTFLAGAQKLFAIAGIAV